MIWTILSTTNLHGALYLDPGSSSYILQIVIAALMGGALAVKIYWSKIVTLFKKQAPQSKDAAEDITTDDEE